MKNGTIAVLATLLILVTALLMAQRRYVAHLEWEVYTLQIHVAGLKDDLKFEKSGNWVSLSDL